MLLKIYFKIDIIKNTVIFIKKIIKKLFFLHSTTILLEFFHKTSFHILKILNIYAIFNHLFPKHSYPLFLYFNSFFYENK